MCSSRTIFMGALTHFYCYVSEAAVLSILWTKCKRRKRLMLISKYIKVHHRYLLVLLWFSLLEVTCNCHKNGSENFLLKGLSCPLTHWMTFNKIVYYEIIGLSHVFSVRANECIVYYVKIFSMKDIPCVDSCLLRLGFLCLMCNAFFMLTSKSLLAESITLKLLHE